MLVKVAEAKGVVLDYLVAKALWGKVTISTFGPLFGKGFKAPCIEGRAIRFQPTVNRSHGSEIIEREGIATRKYGDFPETVWQADKWQFKFAEPQAYGPTLLIAAMRCYVISKLGDEVGVPDELCTGETT